MTMPTKTVQRATLTALTALALLTSLSCKKKPAPPAVLDAPLTAAPQISTGGEPFASESWVEQKKARERDVSADGSKSYAHVTYSPAVKMVDEAAVRSSLLGVSTDGHGAVFQNAPAEVKALKAGDVFMVKGLFAVKIVGVGTEGDKTVLLFDRAKLSETVAKGVIHLDTPISFHGPKIAEARPVPKHHFSLMDLVETPVYAGQIDHAVPMPEGLQPGFNTPKDGVNGGDAVSQAKAFAGLLISGWTIENYSVAPSNNDAVLSLTMTKNTGGFVARVDVKTTVSNFNFTENLKIPFDSSNIVNEISGMSGQIQVKWQVGKQTPGGWTDNDKIKLPVGLTIPLAPMLEGLPLTLDISMALLFHPALTGGNEFAAGGFTLAFNGSNNSEGLSFQIDQDQAITAVAPLGMVMSFCAPRIELQMSPMESFSALKSLASTIDSLVGRVANAVLPADLLAAFAKSPLGNVSLSNALASTADIFVQVIHTEGVTRAPNISLAPCSKVQLVMSGQVGGEANLLGITPGASTTTTVFTKEFDRWNPGSDFCKKV